MTGFFYSLSLCWKLLPDTRLITANPAKNTITGTKLPEFAFDALHSNQATTILNNAQATLVTDDDKPLPGGFEKGVGNLSPETPLIKWGTALDKKAPAKNAAK
jgi:hypothetical protein